jgi:hypothetical protein
MGGRKGLSPEEIADMVWAKVYAARWSSVDAGAAAWTADKARADALRDLSKKSPKQLNEGGAK